MQAPRRILCAVALLAVLSGCGNSYSPQSSLSPRLVQLVLSPASLALAPGGTQQFTVSGRWSDGSGIVPAVTYSATGGTITAAGLYTAGITPGTFQLVATQRAGTEADTSALVVVVPASSSVQFGVHMDAAWVASLAYTQSRILEAKQVHSTVSRNSLLWHLVEPVRGVRDWSLLDSTVDHLLAQGTQPLMVVEGSPAWVNGAATVDSEYYLQVPTDSVAFVAWVAAYKEFIGSAASRYRGKVRLWELGNEENYQYFWRPRPSAVQYAYWYKELRDTIKVENPDAIVAVGGLTLLTVPASRIGPNINGVTFIQQLYAINVFPDAVAVHPYTYDNTGPDVHTDGEGSFDDIAAVRAVMVQAGQGARPMWVTEWGWNTARVTPIVQAEYLRRSLELLDTRYSSYVTIATYFALHDYQPDLFYGLFDWSGNRRLAGDVFEAFMRR